MGWGGEGVRGLQMLVAGAGPSFGTGTARGLNCELQTHIYSLCIIIIIILLQASLQYNCHGPFHFFNSAF